MVEFNLTVNKKQRTAYFNEKIVNTLGYDLAIQLASCAGVIYSKNANREDVIRSVEIVLESLRHQLEMVVRKKK